MISIIYLFNFVYSNTRSLKFRLFLTTKGKTDRKVFSVSKFKNIQKKFKEKNLKNRSKS